MNKKYLLVALIAITLVGCARTKSIWIDPVVIDIRDSMVVVEKIERYRKNEINRVGFEAVKREAERGCKEYNKKPTYMSQRAIFNTFDNVRLKTETHYLFTCSDK